jgi:predicted metal-dependent HD superfamily phosphohydrolase
MIAEDLVSRTWRDLADRHGCDAISANRALNELVRAYAEPHRHYHTLDHIAGLLRLQEEHGGVADEDAVKLAILFHDAVYDPTRQDNEMASANLATKRLSALGLSAFLVAKVERYILATQHGTSVAAGEDADLDMLLGLDLSVLASAPDGYRAYARAIRREYAAVPDALYRTGRRRVLHAFLARPNIYRVERMQALWEASARSNMSDEVATLA